MPSISLTTVALIAAGAGVASAGVSAYEARESGIAQQRMDRQKANVEALNAKQQQITMRQKMLAALASQNAGTLGAVGTGVGTSFGANALRQLSQGQNDLAVNSANASAQISLLDQAGTNAAATGSAAAAAGLIQGVGSNFSGGANSNAYQIGRG